LVFEDELLEAFQLDAQKEVQRNKHTSPMPIKTSAKRVGLYVIKEHLSHEVCKIIELQYHVLLITSFGVNDHFLSKYHPCRHLLIILSNQ
jgi:hypothetical protein